MTGVSATFRALGDSVRCRIVERLADGDMAVGQLAELFPISMQAVSKHIQVLESAGLVSKSKRGQTRTVRLERAALDATSAWIEQHGRRLAARYDRLDEVLVLINAADVPTPLDRQHHDEGT